MDTPDAYSSDRHGDLRELRIRLAVAGAFLLAAIVAGTTDYRIVDPPVEWIDALYMTVVGLATAGFTEVVDLTVRPGRRSLTIVLILVGMGASSTS